MPLDDLFALLERQAEELTERELAQARAGAEEQLAGVREQLDAELRAALDEHREHRVLEGERRLTAARRDSSGRVYQARQELLDRVLAAAEEQLATWGSSRLVSEETLRGLEEALPYLGSDEAVLYAPAPWRATIEERLGRRLRLLESDLERPATLELALVTPDGRRAVDLSPRSRLTRSRAEISIALLRELGVPKWSPTAET